MGGISVLILLHIGDCGTTNWCCLTTSLIFLIIMTILHQYSQFHQEVRYIMTYHETSGHWGIFTSCMSLLTATPCIIVLLTYHLFVMVGYMMTHYQVSIQFKQTTKSLDGLPPSVTRTLPLFYGHEIIKKRSQQLLDSHHTKLFTDKTYLPISKKMLCRLMQCNSNVCFLFLLQVSEKFLAQIMGLLVSSHYRNTPDDLQTLSDAPAHHLLVLLPPQDQTKGDTLPPVLVVMQVNGYLYLQ